jgi:hypothetical protein
LDGGKGEGGQALSACPIKIGREALYGSFHVVPEGAGYRRGDAGGLYPVAAAAAGGAVIGEEFWGCDGGGVRGGVFQFVLFCPVF